MRGTVNSGGAPPRREAGITVIELLVVILLLSILAAAAMPLATYVHKRAQEDELRRSLATLRNAIDSYHDFAIKGQVQAWDVSWDRYPKDLDMLMEGVEVTESEEAEPFTVPITESYDWGFRSYRDAPDSSSWGRENLYDVYCQSTEYALDETLYNEW
jgi:general secretion pathway protein G